MAPRTLPGLGLSGFWTLGEDNWKDANDVNLRTLSALTQPVVLSRVTALPGSPTDGDIYIVPDGAGSNPNEIAIRDNGAWVYLVPEEGWTAYVADANENVQFNGTDWVAFAAGGGATALDDLTDVNAAAPTDGQVLTWDDSAGEWIAADPAGGGGVGEGDIEWSMTIAVSDETTDLTTGDSKITFFMPVDLTLTEVFTTVSGQSSSGNVTIDIRKNGTTIFTTPPSIQASEDTSLTGTVAVLSTTAFVQGDKIEIDIDAAGTGASGLKVAMIGSVAGGGVAVLNDLTDVNAATPADGEVLTWNGTEWAAEAIPGAGALDSLSDVNVPTPTPGFFLTWNGTEWVDGPAVPATFSLAQSKWIPVTEMLRATTSGPAALAQVESGTNDINVSVLDFDASADEYAHFNFQFPPGWNLGTVTFQAVWMAGGAVTTGVAWGLQAIALSDNTVLDTAWGTPVVVTDDAQGAAEEILISAESAAVTIGGTPADGDIVFFRVFRDVSDANDDMTEDARLIGVRVFYTVDVE